MSDWLTVQLCWLNSLTVATGVLVDEIFSMPPVESSSSPITGKKMLCDVTPDAAIAVLSGVTFSHASAV